MAGRSGPVFVDGRRGPRSASRESGDPLPSEGCASSRPLSAVVAGRLRPRCAESERGRARPSRLRLRPRRRDPPPGRLAVQLAASWWRPTPPRRPTATCRCASGTGSSCSTGVRCRARASRPSAARASARRRAAALHGGARSGHRRLPPVGRRRATARSPGRSAAARSAPRAPRSHGVDVAQPAHLRRRRRSHADAAGEQLRARARRLARRTAPLFGTAATVDGYVSQPAHGRLLLHRPVGHHGAASPRALRAPAPRAGGACGSR